MLLYSTCSPTTIAYSTLGSILPDDSEYLLNSRLSVLLILIKQASPSNSVLGKINGLAASAGAAARTIAPPIAGYLYTVGSRVRFTGVAWWASALAAIVGALQLWFMHPKKYSFVSITTGAPGYYQHTETPAPEIVHVSVDHQDAVLASFDPGYSGLV
ncbi:hypothetical protein CISG_07839 [Coccidioides immitis RMSCC 3703]|uniref:Major facilitator superfamily (MFS) profile domain-containing protein n=1 Tax=Coccidioides immitis RMSCC 3703 TaxID=454286 RepID=A0A0J8R6N8_COCIT|nr:hypothetical protein CISG_07839 [Coccidioides immitis RMSCC 3703]